MHAYAVSLFILIQMAACHLQERFHGYRLCTERTLSVNLRLDFSAGGGGVRDGGAPGLHVKAPDAAAAALRPAGAV